ncbi:MAG TPA: hypothetical protein VLD57_03920 [Blastocatellia bacterium]|nr:hypothetical protein [Blastocatellia bacterium]
MHQADSSKAGVVTAIEVTATRSASPPVWSDRPNQAMLFEEARIGSPAFQHPRRASPQT